MVSFLQVILWIDQKLSVAIDLVVIKPSVALFKLNKLSFIYITMIRIWSFLLFLISLLLMNKVAVDRVNNSDIFLSSLSVLEGKRMAPQNVFWG